MRLEPYGNQPQIPGQTVDLAEALAGQADQPVSERGGTKIPGLGWDDHPTSLHQDHDAARALALNLDPHVTPEGVEHPVVPELVLQSRISQRGSPPCAGRRPCPA